MKVSVIIPVYNVKPYLRRCVQSVLRQTYEDLDIILVDDGSTDGSEVLCDQLMTEDTRIRVIHHQNKGLSDARNTGIQHATGDYITFLDADDAWLMDNGLEILIRGMYSECDLIVFKHVDFGENGHPIRSDNYDVDYLNQLLDAQVVFSYLVRTQALRISACFVLIKRQVLIDNNILFLKGIISEDLSWSLHLWQNIRTVTFFNLDFYGYYHRSDSITTTIANTLHAYLCYDKIFSYWIEQCEQGCVNAEVIRAFLADMWVSRGYCYFKLQTSEKQAAISIMRQHVNLLNYAETPKSRRTARLVSILGIRCTLIILSLYWRLRMIVIGH